MVNRKLEATGYVPPQPKVHKGSPLKVWNSVGYHPHPGQRKFHRSEARNRVVSAGRRFGKSMVGGHELDLEAVKTGYMRRQLEDQGQRREFWIVGPNYSDSEKEFRVHYNAMKKIGAPFDKPGTYYSARGGDMQISLYGGLYIVQGMSAMHPESLVGEGLSGVIMAEAAKQKESTWSKYVRPALADFKGWSIHTSTPEGKNWFYDMWLSGQAADNPAWFSMKAPAWLNPHVYPLGATENKIATLRAAIQQGGFNLEALVRRLEIDPEIAQLVLDLTDATFNQEIGADFSEFAGRVFPDFDEEQHVCDQPYNSTWDTYACVDYGFTNPMVWLLLQVDPFGTVYVIDEFYERGMTIDEAAREIHGRGLVPQNLKEFYPDPASPGDTAALERHFRVKAAGGTGGEITQRLRMIRAALKVRNVHLPWGDPERKPQLLINRKCRHTISEMGSYKYPEQRTQQYNEQEKPLKKDDHCPEALGRFYAGHYGAPETAAGGTRIAKVRYH